MKLKLGETICAQSTPQGVGAISVIRISGKKALSLTRKACPFLPKTPKSHHIYYGWVMGNGAGEKLDEVLVSYFEKGKSFTGEESLEISCHGNPVIVKELLEVLISKGVRFAERGEFTYRAFMNGRIDLAQAEGLLGLIQSQNQNTKKIYLQQLEGGFSRYIRKMIQVLQGVHAHIEADIDFSEENLEVSSMENLRNQVEALLSNMNELLHSFQKGRLIQEGLKVFLIGPPNVGKSSLFNVLLGKEKAIVTKAPGTTRDILEANLHIENAEGILFDTAGLRSTKEEVERIGVEKVKEIVSRKEGLFLFVLDLSKPILEKDLIFLKELKHLKPENTLILGNKIDLFDFEVFKNFKIKDRNTKKEEFILSPKKKKGFLNEVNSRDTEIFYNAEKETPFSMIKQKEKLKKEKIAKEVLKSQFQKASKGLFGSKWKNSFHSKGRFLVLSAKEDSYGLLKLKKFLKSFFLKKTNNNKLNYLMEVRHYELLLQSKKHLIKALNLMKKNEVLDIIAFELRESLLPLYEILGEKWDEQVIDRIFKEFCLGK